MLYNTILFKLQEKTVSNHVMQVDFFGNTVRAETEGTLVSLTDLAKAGNMWRASKGMSIKPLQAVVESVGFIEFVKVAQADMPGQEILFSTGKGNSKRTMAHVIIAIYFSEQYSPEFHYSVIKTFIEGKLLEFRDQGGTEFKNLNAAIDLYLPDREGKDNKGCYINVAKLVRAKLLGADAVAGDWETATVAQMHSRYEFEKRLIDYMNMGMVRDYPHLKELIGKL